MARADIVPLLPHQAAQGGGHRTLLYGHAILLRHSFSGMVSTSGCSLSPFKEEGKDKAGGKVQETSECLDRINSRGNMVVLAFPSYNLPQFAILYFICIMSNPFFPTPWGKGPCLYLTKPNCTKYSTLTYKILSIDLLHWTNKPWGNWLLEYTRITSTGEKSTKWNFRKIFPLFLAKGHGMKSIAFSAGRVWRYYVNPEAGESWPGYD